MAGLTLPVTRVPFAQAEEAELRHRFELLRHTSAGALVRLNEDLLAGIDALSPPLSFEVRIEWVSIQGKALHLSENLQATVKREEGEFVFEVPSLNLFAYGHTVAEAQEELFGQMESLVRRFNPLSDEQMTPSGRELRRRLSALGLLHSDRGSD